MTLVLISVVAAFSWPRFTSFYQAAEAKQLQLTTVHVLNAARLAALTQGKRVLVCLSDDGLRCAPLGKKYWLSVWKTGAEKPNMRAVPLNANHVQLHWRVMAENQGGILFTPTTVGNGRVWACRAGQARPLWVLSMSRFGGVHEQADVRLRCEAV